LQGSDHFQMAQHFIKTFLTMWLTTVLWLHWYRGGSFSGGGF